MDPELQQFLTRMQETLSRNLDHAVGQLMDEISTRAEEAHREHERSDARFEAMNGRLERQSGVIQAMLRGSARL